MRVAQAIGKPRAQALLASLAQRATSERRPLRELLRAAVAADAALRGRIGDDEIDALFDPDVAVRAAAARTDELLARWRPRATALAAAKPWQTALAEDPT
jgi:hypothetical protein